MIGYGSLESQFAQYNREINQYKMMGDYENMIKTIRLAMTCCQRIYEEATDTQKKTLMAKNAQTLQALYNQCKKALEDQGKPIPTETPKPTKSTGNGGSQGGSKGGSQGGGSTTETEKKTEKGAADYDVEYTINGVDVKQFLANESNEVVTFEDVKGMVDEKELIAREFFLSEEERRFSESIGRKAKTFILLYGVPGTGKTFFAKAISNELKLRAEDGDDVPFFSVVATQLKDCKVGASEKNIQAVFEFCKQFKHCVLFLDEFEAVAPDRKQNNGDPTAASCVTTLLQMMDGFNSSKGTLVIAATNCPYNLDGAILSRANTRIEIPLPTAEVISGTLKSKIASKMDPSVSFDEIVKRLDGYSNRDIKNFIEVLKDTMFDEYRKNKKNGDTRGVDDYTYTQEMFEVAFKRIVPTTKQSDIERINEFKLKGE
ncbi:MAG: ATP-binding protein [Clostridia bacterium]|nr:ATP-binding protein [Clostridia bacterium]